MFPMLVSNKLRQPIVMKFAEIFMHICPVLRYKVNIKVYSCINVPEGI